MKLALSSLPKYPGELEGQRPSSAEEEGASPDDETKDLRRKALRLTGPGHYGLAAITSFSQGTKREMSV